MEYLESIGEKVGLRNMDLDNIKKQASFFLRDKIKSARLFLTDATNSQLMTEEATNDDDWGPSTKSMAAIADACFRTDECPRIMQVLHGRLGLIGKKYWRQFLKTLTIVEFLLFHGPEQSVMEFGSDRDVIEDLSRFNYIDERGVDRGTVVRKKATQVLKLLTEDAYLKDERDKAKKLTKTILGQGSSQSSSGHTSSSRYGGFGNADLLSSGRKGHEFDRDSEEFHIDKKFTAFEERILSEKRGNRPETKLNANAESANSDDWRAFEDDAAPIPSTADIDETSWANFSNSGSDSIPKLNDSASGKDIEIEYDTSLQPSQISRSGLIPKLNGSASGKGFGIKTPSKTKNQASTFVPVTSMGNTFKLPPPPPPPGGSKTVTSIKTSKLPQSMQPVPDLLDMFDSTPIGSANVLESDQGTVDRYLDIEISTTTGSTPAVQSVDDHSSLQKAQASNSQLVHEVPDIFSAFGRESPLSYASTSNNSASKNLMPDFFDLGIASASFGVVGEQISHNSPDSSANFVAFEDQVPASKQTGIPTGLPDLVPDFFDGSAPDFAAFSTPDVHNKESVAKPADGFFNLLD